MDLSQVENLTIPEGNVTKIMSGDTLLWKKMSDKWEQTENWDADKCNWTISYAGGYYDNQALQNMWENGYKRINGETVTVPSSTLTSYTSPDLTSVPYPQWCISGKTSSNPIFKLTLPEVVTVNKVEAYIRVDRSSSTYYTFVDLRNENGVSLKSQQEKSGVITVDCTDSPKNIKEVWIYPNSAVVSGSLAQVLYSLSIYT